MAIMFRNGVIHKMGVGLQFAAKPPKVDRATAMHRQLEHALKTGKVYLVEAVSEVCEQKDEWARLMQYSAPLHAGAE